MAALLWGAADSYAAVKKSKAFTSSAGTVSSDRYTGKTRANLNLRKTMTTKDNSNIIEVVKKDTIVAIIKREQAGWYQVEVHGKSGYMSSDYLVDNTDIMKTTANVYMRKGASASTSFLALITKGSKVEVIRRVSNGWVYCSYRGKVGYVSGTYLEKVETEKEKEKETEKEKEKKKDTGKTISLKNVELEDITVYYDGKYHSLPKVQNLPKGVKVKYSTSKRRKNIGTYKVKASFRAENSKDKLTNAKTRTAYLKIRVKKGATYKVGDFKYKITNPNIKGKGTASVIAPVKKSIKTATVRRRVSIGGKKFIVTSVAKNAFKDCKKLKIVKLGKGIETVGAGAFKNCKKLEDVTFGTHLKSIGKEAFAGDKKLKVMRIRSHNLKKVGSKALKGTAENLIIFGPQDRLEKYQKLFAGKGQSEKAQVK